MKKWHTVVTYDLWGRRLRQLVGRWLTLGEALAWMRASGEPMATLFEWDGHAWKHIPWAWTGLEQYRKSALTAQSTWGRA